jgi:hypothetical protein
VLRAILWRTKGNLQGATRIASRAGSTFGLVLIGFGIVRGLTGEFLGGLWFVLIGLFLRQAAEGSYQQLVVQRALAPLRVRDVMTHDVIQVSPDTPPARVVHDHFWRHHVTSFPVVDHGRVVRILSLHRLGDVPREQWPATESRQRSRSCLGTASGVWPSSTTIAWLGTSASKMWLRQASADGPRARREGRSARMAVNVPPSDDPHVQPACVRCPAIGTDAISFARATPGRAGWRV